ncbi:MAG: FAD-binding oxidoreductase [Acidimicrobiales bacterium]
MVKELEASMSGSVIDRTDPEYDEARRVWNADIDGHPAVIARCTSPEDVVAAIAFARRYDLEIAVRGGAHSMPGVSTVDDGLVIDLSLLNGVTVDPDARRAQVGGGALLRDLDAATQAHGLAVPAGLVSHTGVGGLTVGGGMGWLTRLAGLTIDNLVSAQVVTADGRFLRASDEENADLFWAIRGGGGNYGVVTGFEFRLHRVGPIVHVGLLFWSLDDGAEVLRLAREVIPALPPEVNVVIAGVNAPPAPFVPAEHHHQPGYGLFVVGFGSPEDHQGALAQLRGAVPPLWEFADSMPYVALQQMLDEANDWGFYCYDKGTYLAEISDDAIQAVTEHLPAKNSPLSLLLFYRLDGAYSDVPEDGTAFSGGRSPRYAVFIIGVCPTPELLQAERVWVRSMWDALRPCSIDIGSYVNAMTDVDEDRLRASYGPDKYARLGAIKRTYDPDNVFHRNANIKPA